jgi:hypothetical protein
VHAVNDPRVGHRGPHTGRRAGMRQDSSWRSGAGWPCETGQGRLWHGLAPRAKARDDGVGGRSLRTRAILPPPWHGVNSFRARMLNYPRVTGHSIVKRCLYTSQLRRTGVGDLLIRNPSSVDVRYKALCGALIFARSETFGLRFTGAHFRVQAAMVRLRQKVRSQNPGSCRPRAAAGRPLAGLEVVEKLLTSKPSPPNIECFLPAEACLRSTTRDARGTPIAVRVLIA